MCNTNLCNSGSYEKQEPGATICVSNKVLECKEFMHVWNFHLVPNSSSPHDDVHESHEMFFLSPAIYQNAAISLERLNT
ncbi:hypothetical protein GE061_011046 [Apolygus lucorum]|uniref:Uncharacterized protein n=1 Tax=Apolygus lucorum TaxID=248454 RepID=A0A8S9XWP4_APOLU|nr:hypothetical protein GE061_011046 [Apolygus lucorum]